MKTDKVLIGKDVSKMSNVELHGVASPKTTAWHDFADPLRRWHGPCHHPSLDVHQPRRVKGWRFHDVCRLDERDSRIDNVKFLKIHYFCALYILIYIYRVKYTEHIDYPMIYFWFMLHISFLVCLYNTRHLSFKKELHTNWNFQINTSIPKSSLTSIIEKPSHQHSSPQLMFVGKASRICWGLFVVEPKKAQGKCRKTRIFLQYFKAMSKLWRCW